MAIVGNQGSGSKLINTDIKTAGYTVPAGFKARIKVARCVFVNAGAGVGEGGLLIDGGLFYPNLCWSLSDVDQNEYIYMPIAGELYVHGSQPLSMNKVTQQGDTTHLDQNDCWNVNALGTNNSGTAFILDQWNITLVAQGNYVYQTNYTNQDMRMFLKPYQPIADEIWIPALTVVSFTPGTAFQYAVELYEE